MDTRTETSSYILRGDRVGTVPWEPSDTAPVRTRWLWKDPHGGSSAGLMHLEPGATLRPHSHLYACHHAFVVEGACWVNGERLDPGSYTFVPASVEHRIERAGPEGCTLFFLYAKADMD